MKNDVYRVKQMLTTKSILFEEVDLSLDKSRRGEMIEASGGIQTLPQVHVGGKVRSELKIC